MIKRLKKTSWHDWNVVNPNRTYAISIINKKIYTDETHALSINQFLREHGEEELLHEVNRPDVEVDLEDQVQSFIAAHFVENDGKENEEGKRNDAIYVDLNSRYNITRNEVIEILKAQYPNADLYIEDRYDTKQPLERNKESKKFQRLKKNSSHDWGSRNYAVSIINNKVYKDETHTMSINQFLKEIGEEQLRNEWSRPDVKSELSDHIDSFVAAHLVHQGGERNEDGKFNDAIYVDLDSMVGSITLKEIISLLKENFPNADLYDDDRDGEYEKLENY